jgi:hypothetical protein
VSRLGLSGAFKHKRPVGSESAISGLGQPTINVPGQYDADANIVEITEYLEETLTTILLAGVLGFLVALAIVLTLMRMDMTRDTFTSDGSDDRPV